MPIPDEEMQEWLEQTVQRISSLKPDHVLEIGCGLGLLLFCLAPLCSRYVGTDFSTVALEHINTVLGLRELNLRHRHTDPPPIPLLYFLMLGRTCCSPCVTFEEL